TNTRTQAAISAMVTNGVRSVGLSSIRGMVSVRRSFCRGSARSVRFGGRRAVTRPMRASWKGQLRLQLVSCPVKLDPATTRAGKIGFHNLNPRTGHRINLRPHDPDTGDEVAKEDIVKGYEVEKGHYV